jgi:hypothetical protein
MNKDTGELVPVLKKTPRVWHPQHEIILKAWGESSGCYRFMHFKAFKHYRFLNALITLPVIIISTITGTANFAQSTIPTTVQLYIPFIIGTMSLIAAILTTVQQYLKIAELAEEHKTGYICFGKLARDIRVQVSLPVQERGYHGENFVSFCNTEYDRLIEKTPPIPGFIIRHFKKRFDESNVTHDTSFSRPEFLSVAVIQPYPRTFETILKEHTDRMRSETSHFDDDEYQDSQEFCL